MELFDYIPILYIRGSPHLTHNKIKKFLSYDVYYCYYYLVVGYYLWWSCKKRGIHTELTHSDREKKNKICTFHFILYKLLSKTNGFVNGSHNIEWNVIRIKVISCNLYPIFTNFDSAFDNNNNTKYLLVFQVCGDMWKRTTFFFDKLFFS